MTTETNEACTVCWGVVPRTLMSFHRMWHDEQGGRAEKVGARPARRVVRWDIRPAAPTFRGRPEVEPLSTVVSRSSVTPSSAEVRNPRPGVLVQEQRPAPTPRSRAGVRRRSLVVAGLVLVFLVFSGTELVTHLRHTGESGVDSEHHPDTLIPHPH